MKVCKRCGCAVFYAHQIVRMDIFCDGDGNFEENISANPAADIYDSEPPYGPFTCRDCGAEYENLDELDAIEPITKAEIIDALLSGAAVLEEDPEDPNGVICRIGQYWFNLGHDPARDTEDGFNFETFLKHHTTDEIAEEVLQCLGSMKNANFSTEYLYYTCYLREQRSRRQMKGGLLK